MRKDHTIRSQMTPMPHTIGSDLSIRRAASMMKEFRIRHLPVQQGGKLVGMLSDRDVKLAASFSDDEDLPVEEVMQQEVYVVAPTASLEAVALHMAENRLGSAVIEEHGKVIGIFTSMDALRLLGEGLRDSRGGEVAISGPGA